MKEKGGQHRGKGRNRRERGGGWRGVSCSLNSSRLFKARACSRAGTALIKDAALERPSELGGGARTRLAQGVQVGRWGATKQRRKQ